MPDRLGILNVGLAAKNVRTDVFGDWHRDPWDWPELEYVASRRPDLLTTRLDAQLAYAWYPLDVAKENFFTRPAVVFDIVDRLAIQTLVDRVSNRVLDGAPTWMYSWRLSRRKPQAGHYTDMNQEWSLYRRHLIKLSAYYPYAITTDIVSCFACVPLDRLVMTVQQRAAGGVVTDRLCQVIEEWRGIPRRGGVPQRANASSVLVNAYLKPVDDCLAFYGAVSGNSILSRLVPEGAAMRWVDDIWLFGYDSARLRAAQLDLEDVTRDLGLNLNAAKTELLEGDDLVRKARRLEHSAVDVALNDFPASRQELDQLVARILDKPFLANRTTIRFATVRIRRVKAWDLVEQFVAKAHLMPQGASALARVFRDSGYWRDLGPWYVSHATNQLPKISWSVAELGTMFPTAGPVIGEVADYLEKAITERTSLSMFALAAQRLAAWRPANARVLFRELAGQCHHPQERRILALAALNAGEERAWVGKLLREHVENRSTLEYLEERNFVAVPPGGDSRGY